MGCCRWVAEGKPCLGQSSGGGVALLRQGYQGTRWMIAARSLIPSGEVRDFPAEARTPLRYDRGHYQA